MSLRAALMFLLEKALKCLRKPPSALAEEAPAGPIGLSFDSGITLAELPVFNEFRVNMFCIPNKQVGVIEVLEIDSSNNTMRIREVCTENEFTIGIEVFNFLFVEKPPVALDTKF